MTDGDSINSLPYNPKYKFTNSFDKPKTSTYLAYNFDDQMIAMIRLMCIEMFKVRPVWTYDEMWSAVKNSNVGNIYYKIDEDIFLIALSKLQQPFGTPPCIINFIKPYLIISKVDAVGKSTVDIESYIREFGFVNSAPIKMQHLTVKIREYISKKDNSGDFQKRLDDFSEIYKNDQTFIESFLINYSAGFHYKLLKLLIEGTKKLTFDDKLIISIYRRYKILYTYGEIKHCSKVLKSDKYKSSDIVGYLRTDTMYIYNGEWYEVPNSDLDIGRRYYENDIVVGYVESYGNSINSDALSTIFVDSKFKIRLPSQKMKTDADERSKDKYHKEKSDNRNLAKGSICTTKPRPELIRIYNELNKLVQKTGGGRRSNVKELIMIPTNELCIRIQAILLKLEEDSRNADDGMMNGVRWIYLFNDITPNMNLISHN